MRFGISEPFRASCTPRVLRLILCDVSLYTSVVRGVLGLLLYIICFWGNATLSHDWKSLVTVVVFIPLLLFRELNSNYL